MNQFVHLLRFAAASIRRSCRPGLSLLAVLAVLYTPSFATPQDAWQKGNACYRQKQYDSAAFYFEQIAASKPADATIYYNLGNTYYRLNKIGLSVLNYERALKRRPSYPEAGDNLLLAQSRIPGGVRQEPGDIFFVRWWKAMTAPGLVLCWSVLSLLFFIGLIGLLLYRRLRRSQVYIRPQYIGALTLLWLASLLLAFASVCQAMSDVRAVVIAGDATVSHIDRKSRYAAGIPEGTVVRVLSRTNGMVEIALPDGNTGVLPQSALALVD